MGFFHRSSSKNPQSASNSYSSSGSGGRGEGHSESQLSLDDDNVPTVNLTERRLRDWKNNNGVVTTTTIGVGSGDGSGAGEPFPAGGVVSNIPLTAAYRGGGGEKGDNKSNIHVDFISPIPPPRNNPKNYACSSPNNLILLIERGKWAAATERARSHDHEVRQLVKLRKTTKNAPPMMSPSHNFGVMVVGAAATGAEGGGGGTGAGASSSRGGGCSTSSQRVVGSSGGHISGKKNVQISNVKCKALHHACQKLRSVHTTIYQTKSVVAQAVILEDEDSNTRRLIIEEDEYIEACKCILMLIRVHPEACRERESRHGCLPLHLCVFSMCDTPPPPTPPTPLASPLPQSLVDAVTAAASKGREDIMNGMKMLFGTGSPSSSWQTKQTLPSGAAASSPRSSLCPPLPTKPTPAKEEQRGKEFHCHQSNHHRTVNSNSSADFSLGNISQMIQEESDHQRALTYHQQNTKKQGKKNTKKQRQLNDGVESDDGKSMDELDKIYKGMDDMERLLMGLESKYEKDKDKEKDKGKKKKKRINISKKKNGTDDDTDDSNNNNRKDSVGKIVRKVEGGDETTLLASSAITSAAAKMSSTTSTTTTIINVMTTLDCLEERSRETDSHSTLRDSLRQDVGGVGGGSNGSKSSSLWSSSDESNDYDALEAAHHNGGIQFFKMTAPSSSSSSGVMTFGCNKHKNANNISTTTTAVLTSSSPLGSLAISNKTLAPTYEDLQRRYLQINRARREEYSVRVINALLDAWPKSVKTSSEGGRLPLHMACFGRATVGVMETILKAYPDAARQRNHDGFLPVHIAAHWGVSHPDIAPLLLRAYPDGAVGRNRWERTPIEEALGMAGENGRQHQMSLVWSLRRHPTYWIHNDIGTMLLPRNVRMAPWRMVDVEDDGDLPSTNKNDVGIENIAARRGRISSGSRCGGAVDVDDVGSSDDDDEG
jgi:hypothetical protein